MKCYVYCIDYKNGCFSFDLWNIYKINETTMYYDAYINISIIYLNFEKINEKLYTYGIFLNNKFINFENSIELTLFNKYAYIHKLNGKMYEIQNPHLYDINNI